MKDNAQLKPYLRSFYQNNHLLGALALILTLLGVAFDLTVSWLLGAVLDTTTSGDLDALMGLLGVAVAWILVLGMYNLLETWVRAAWVHRAMGQYKALAFQRLTEKSVSAFTRENTGRYLSVLTNDAAVIEEKYLLYGLRLCYNALLFLGALVLMFLYSPTLTGASLAFSLLPLLASILAGGPMARREKEVSDQNEAFVSQVKDLVGGFAVLKSFKAEGEARARFGEANGRTEGVKRRRDIWNGLIESLGGVCSAAMQFGIYFLGAFLAIRGEVTVGTVVVFIQCANYVFGPIRNIPQLWAGRKAARGLIEKLAQSVEENAGRTGEQIEPALREAIELKGVSFGYGEDTPVLRDLSMRLEAGKKYALVGPSGSGKSTLLNLLMGAWEDYGGSVTVDGRELRDIDPDSLYDLTSLIGQNVYLFDDTIRRNITLFKDFPDEAVASAEARSGLGALIAEKGEDYLCGENGGNLSGGERQRVSIARCLLRNTPVLMLDEATAALDNRTAFEVVDSLLKLEGLTRLVVTHRLEKELLEQYDGIFVLRNGTVCEKGTFRELMARGGVFYSLYTLSGEHALSA